MKRIVEKFMAVMAIGSMFVSCSQNDDTSVATDQLADLSKFKEVSNATHTIELYSNRAVEQGYNEIQLRIKDISTGEYVKDADVSWTPMMHMSMMTHSCPNSDVTKVTAGGSLYRGYIVFQMPQNDLEYWDLTINYIIAGTPYTITTPIDVPASTLRRVTSFTGTDGKNYIVAYVEPQLPKVAVNNMIVSIFKMQDMMHFPVADGCTLKIDPRMPSMGNHGSPNNVDATQQAAGGFYTGKMSLTMTGFWRINLQLQNADGTVLKGETVGESIPESSLYFEIEF